MLAPVEEAAILELARQLARRRQREAELLRQLADRALALGADVREHRDVSPRQRRPRAGGLEQVVARSPPLPQPAHDAAQQAAQLAELAAVHHRASVII